MGNNFSDLISKYSTKGIIIDTNLFLLFVIGISDEVRIETFKRTIQYKIQDFHLLSKFISNFQKIMITPNILTTEVNSLLNQLNEKEKVFDVFKKIINEINENYFESKILSSNKMFHKFGLTDLSIEELSKGSYLVLTDDLKLFSYLSSKNIDIINFNHIRVSIW